MCLIGRLDQSCALPYGEPDFGAVEHSAARAFGGIGSYTPDVQPGSESPADPAIIYRVPTVMLAEVY